MKVLSCVLTCHNVGESVEGLVVRGERLCGLVSLFAAGQTLSVCVGNSKTIHPLPTQRYTAAGPSYRVDMGARGFHTALRGTYEHTYKFQILGQPTVTLVIQTIKQNHNILFDVFFVQHYTASGQNTAHQTHTHTLQAGHTLTHCRPVTHSHTLTHTHTVTHSHSTDL